MTLLLGALAGYLAKAAWGQTWGIVIFLAVFFGSGLVIQLIRWWRAERHA